MRLWQIVRLEAKRRRFPRRNPPFQAENLQSTRLKLGRGSLISFRKMSDFKALPRIFLPTSDLRRKIARGTRAGVIRAGKTAFSVRNKLGIGSGLWRVRYFFKRQDIYRFLILLTRWRRLVACAGNQRASLVFAEPAGDKSRQRIQRLSSFGARGRHSDR